jgi:hypothetical protein
MKEKKYSSEGGKIQKHLATLIYSSVFATIEIYAYRFQLRRDRRSAESNQVKFAIVVEGAGKTNEIDG